VECSLGWIQSREKISNRFFVMVMELMDVDCGILSPTKSSLEKICTWNNKNFFRTTKGDLLTNSGNHCMA
jgi:hypothetical protein